MARLIVRIPSASGPASDISLHNPAGAGLYLVGWARLSPATPPTAAIRQMSQGDAWTETHLYQ
jgi:hypothetical protein